MMHMIWRRLDRRDDSGFTILEMVVALMMIALAMTALAMLYISVAGTAQLARERQEATQLANQTLEEMRALPYTTLTSGLVNCGTELTGDPNLQSVAGGWHFKPAYNSSIDEVLQSYTPSSCGSVTAVAPLYPHVTSPPVVYGKVSFTKRAYVSQVANTNPQAFWITSIITWTSAATKNKLKTIAMRSQVFSSSTCLSTSTHPFSGPCQAFFYGNAGASAGSITVAGLNGAPMVTGIDATGGVVYLPELSSGMQVEQTTSLTGKAFTSGASVTTSTGTSKSGNLNASVLADSDPSTVGATTATATTPAQSAPAVTAGVPGQGQWTLTPSSADTGSLVGTVAASASPACKDVDGTTTFSTSQPCASGNVQALGTTASAVLNLPTLYSRNLGNMTVASVAAAPSPVYAMTTRFVGANATYCPTATGAGCAVSSAKRSLGAVVVGGLPVASGGDTVTSPNTASTLAASAFSGLVKLSSYNDAAIASSGVGAGSSSVSRTGTLQYWDPANCSGTGNYCSVSLGTGAVSKTAGATAHYQVEDGSTVDIAMSATITVSSAAPTTSGASPCQSPACTTQSAVSPMTVTVSYTISHLGQTLGAFNVTTDLGRLLAKSTYRAAPNG